MRETGLALELPDYNLSEEQIEFRDTLRRFFEENSPMTEVRAVMGSESGLSRGLWKQLCEGGTLYQRGIRLEARLMSVGQIMLMGRLL